MSDNVMSSGFMAVLQTPFTEENREEKDEWLYEQQSNLRINYEGTMVFSDNRSDGYGLSIHTNSAQAIDQGFVQDCNKLGLTIDPNTIRGYSCYWYNGSDSDMNMLTLEKYMKRLHDRSFNAC
jgi:hypothetical protein